MVIAAIDVGSSAIRMDIAEIHSDGSIKTLERLSKGVSLGKDTFTSDHLSEESIQTACQVLSDFSRVMKTYGVSKYRAVATSAVREAGNSDTFLDRAFMRSGIEIEVIDGSEENRLTYLAIYQAMTGVLDLQNRNTVIFEVGGGSTDISFLQKGETFYSGTFALGAVRLQQALLDVKGETRQRIKILERQIKNTIATIAVSIPFGQVEEVIALGGDIRFAARQLSNQQEDPWILDRKDFTRFVSEISKLSVEELVGRYGLAYSQAETLIPALLAYRSILEKTKVEKFHVSSASIRTGILMDMLQRETGRSPAALEKQILASARAVARKYLCNENHMEQVRLLSLSLFDQLASVHGLGSKERLLLEVAALLHDVGTFINTRAHHKHSQYIIANSEIFGLSRHDLDLISNIARYHRKSPPTRAHLAYIALDRESRMIVSKLAAILRVADALDQDDVRKIKSVKITRDDESERFTLEVEAEGDLTMERLAVENKGDLFQEIYGKPVVLRQVERIEASTT